MNRLSVLIKRQKLSDWIKNKHTTASKYTERMKVKNIYISNYLEENWFVYTNIRESNV